MYITRLFLFFTVIKKDTKHNSTSFHSIGNAWEHVLRKKKLLNKRMCLLAPNWNENEVQAYVLWEE